MPERQHGPQMPHLHPEGGPPPEHIGGRTPTRDHRGPWPSCLRRRSFLGRHEGQGTMPAGGPRLAGHTSLLTCLIAFLASLWPLHSSQKPQCGDWAGSLDNPSPILAFPDPAGPCSRAGKHGSHTMESSSPVPEPLTPSPPPGHRASHTRHLRLGCRTASEPRAAVSPEQAVPLGLIPGPKHLLLQLLRRKRLPPPSARPASGTGTAAAVGRGSPGRARAERRAWRPPWRRDTTPPPP